MLRRTIIGSVVLLLAGQLSRADLTLRYSMDSKMAALPGAPSMNEQMASMFPKESVTYVKGDKIYGNTLNMPMIMDIKADQITLMSPDSKKFATMPMSEFPPKMGTMAHHPEAQHIFDSMKVDMQTRKTGRAGMLHGIRAEEYEIVMSMEMPGLPSHMSSGFKMVAQYWTAAPEEMDRIPSLKEFSAYSVRAKSLLNSSGMMTRAFSQLPGMDKFIEPFMKMSDKLTLKMHMAMYMPMMGKSQPAGAKSDAPMMELTMELIELSDSPIPDTIFEVPTDYQAAPAEEIMKSMMPAPALPVAH